MIAKTKLSKPKLLSKAQKIFNSYIRERDKDKGCISCGSKVTQAGHYFSQGHHSALRFNEINTNGQCVRCNMFLSGNLINYRKGLIKKYGEEKVNQLEIIADLRKVFKWTSFELENIVNEYGKINRRCI